ncbi:yls2-like [Stylosanthes scabra]|uniref:Yls2-like n=1 Tax=Stylosanthes scabra TaxID=79078 RepID=A0ABU6X7Y7_9FABA|nr:yls2-like [Stylosanthes scabra]
MSHTKRADSASQTRSDIPGRRTRPWFFTITFFFIVLPVVIAAVLFQLNRFDPVQLPVHYMSRSNSEAAAAVARNDNTRRGSEVIGNGRVSGPEDLAYDPVENVIYTGCIDGWIKRVKLSDDSAVVVEDWVNTGGRPLGVALDRSGSLIVSDPKKFQTMPIMDDVSLQQMISSYLENMAHASVIDLYVEFEQIPYVVGEVEEAQPDLAFDGYYSDSEEEFEGNYEMDDENEEDVLEHDTESEVEDVANALANELPFQEPSFMRVLDENAMKAPEFAEDMNPGYSKTVGEYETRYEG